MAENAGPWSDNWNVERELGAGGQGTTWLVSSKGNPSLKGVIKRLKFKDSAQARGRMRIEAVTLDVLGKQGLKVPRLLASNIGPKDDPNVEPYFVMEFVDGQTLADVIRVRGKLSLERATACTLDLLGTLGAAHKLGYRHRDIKPDNIIVRDLEKPDLVMVDFGLSYNAEHVTDTLTYTGEQLRNSFLALPETNTPGGNCRDPRSDLTAIAAIYYFCLTGHKPGQLRDEKGKAPHRRIGYSVRDPLGSDMRCQAVESLLDCAFSVELEYRFQTAEKLELRLAAALSPQSAKEEDLATVAAELSRDLRQRNRKTQLAEYQRMFQPTIQEMMQQVGRLQKVASPFMISIGGVSTVPFPDGFEPVHHGMTVEVRMHPHTELCLVTLAVGAKGNECMIMRCATTRNAAGQIANTPWEEVFQFNPEEAPEAAVFCPLVDRAIQSGIRAFHALLTDGKS